MKNTESHQSDMPVHSEKVNRILGDIPKSLTQYCFITILCIFMLLLTISLTVKYPYGEGESILMHIIRSLG